MQNWPQAALPARNALPAGLVVPVVALRHECPLLGSHRGAGCRLWGPPIGNKQPEKQHVGRS